MDDQSLRNVLAIMREVKKFDQLQPVHSFIYNLAGQDVSPRQLLRIAAYLQDQIDQARTVITSSNLAEEAKAGVYQALNQIAGMFSLGGLSGQIGSYSSGMDGYIANFVILLSAAGLPTAQENPQEAFDLASEIDKLSKSMESMGLDPDVLHVARQHMIILSTLLRHIPVFGLEPALSAYFELVAKIRRADSKSSDTSKESSKGLMERIGSWADRLKTLDESINAGANLLQRAQIVTPLLQYVPGLS